MRLRLRKPLPVDAEIIFNTYAQDPEVTRYLPWSPHQRLSDSEAFIQRCLGCWSDGSAFPWVIETRQGSEVVGMIELRLKGHQADVGYVIARPCWGEGYATESLICIVEWAFQQDGIWRFYAICDIDNGASLRVLEKSGLQKEGLLRKYLIHPEQGSVPRDCYMYAKVR